MKAITKGKLSAGVETNSCCQAVRTVPVAQCCSKSSKVVAGCHD